MSDPDTIYIAGPMSNLPQYNRPEFCAAEVILQRHFPESAIINPSENFSGNQSLKYALYMRLSIHQLLMVQAVCMLPAWEKSRGALLEKQVADCLGLAVFFLQSNGELELPEL